MSVQNNKNIFNRPFKEYLPPIENREEKLRLDFNENLFCCSPKVLDAIKNVSPESISRYPDYSKVIHVLSKHFDVNEDQLKLTNGADDAINSVINAFLNEGDQTIILDPTFPMFEVYLTSAKAEIKKVKYTLHEDYLFPKKYLLDMINKETRLVILVNPNNPTGTEIPESDLLEVMEKTKEQGCFLLLDEAYCEFLGSSSVKLINKFNNLIIVRSFSKAYGLAGLRAGCVLSNKSNIGLIKKVSSPYNVNSLAVIAVMEAIKDQAFVSQYVCEVEVSKRIIQNALRGMGFKVFSSKANFLLVDFKKNKTLIYESLKKNRILTRPINNNEGMENFLRITLPDIENSKKLIAIIDSLKNEGTLL